MSKTLPSKKTYVFIALGIIFLFAVTTMMLSPENQTVETNSASNIENGGLDDITTDRICDNYNEIQYYEEPVPVTWEARMDGCLVNCQGGSFTTTNQDSKYSRFAGYYPGKSGEYDSSVDNPIPEDYLGKIVRVTGDWIGIDADHPLTVFNGQCVPIINIVDLEIAD